MNVRELCRLLSATIHVPNVDHWAEQLCDREFLPSLDHEVTALDAAIMLGAIAAAPRPAEAATGGPLMAETPSLVPPYQPAISAPGEPQKSRAFLGHSARSGRA